MRYRLEEEEPRARRAQPAADVQFELGPRSLLILLGCLAVLCGLFYALGYTVGRHTASVSNSPAPEPAPAMAQPISHASAPGFTPDSALPVAANNANAAGATSGAQPPNPANLSAAEQGQVPATLAAPASAPVYAAATNSGAASTSSLPAAGTAISSSSASPPATRAGKYAVQVFAGLRSSDALSLAAALKARQYPVFIVSPGNGNPYYKVQIGPYGQLPQAQAMRARLMAAGYHAVIK